MAELAETISKVLEDTKPHKGSTEKAIGKKAELPGAEAMYGNFIQVAKGYKSEFVIDTQNEYAIKKLCQYFAFDKSFETNGLSLDKGIYLYGDVGSGKTTIMEVFMALTKPQKHNKFQIHSTRDVAQKFANEGFKGIEQYGKNSYLHHTNGKIDKERPIDRCFDDFGLEDNSTKFYGNACNVMAEILIDRYEGFRHYAMITHLTSNIDSGDQTEAMYGNRVRSRMREMFNFIELSGKDRRK